MTTANGIAEELLWCQYHASAGTSYSASTQLPVCIPPCRPCTATMRLMKCSGGPGILATERVPSKRA
jgi:hypothetical protein